MNKREKVKVGRERIMKRVELENVSKYGEEGM